jgi:antitoxin Phd
MSPSSAARSREPVPAFRNRRGEAVEASSVTATDAKKQFGRVLEMVLRGGAVVITKHDAPKAILLSVDEFNALTRTTESKLDSLSADFDAMLARMQTPRARSGMRAAFGASPKALGRAAVTAAR